MVLAGQLMLGRLTIVQPWFSRCTLMGLFKTPDGFSCTTPVAVAGGSLKTLACRVGAGKPDNTTFWPALTTAMEVRFCSALGCGVSEPSSPWMVSVAQVGAKG